MAGLKELTTPASYSTQEELEALLLEGLHSGEAIEVTPQFWAGLHAELAERRSANNKAS
jgi:hypothetical protein